MPSTKKTASKASKKTLSGTTSAAKYLVTLLAGGLVGFQSNQYLKEENPVPRTEVVKDNDFQVRFSPKGGCTELAIKMIQKAKKSVLVQAYSFTSKPITDALIAAHQKGIEVKVLVDRTQRRSRGTKFQVVRDSGIPVWVDKVTGIAHNKVLLIDNEYVVTGSFNWSDAAENRNAENLVFIHNKSLNRIYTSNWEKRAEKSIKN